MACLSADSVGLYNDDGLTLSHVVEHTSICLEEGVGEEWGGGGEYDVATRSETRKPQTARGATAQWPNSQLVRKERIPARRTASTEPTSTKGIKLLQENYWK